MAATSLPNRLQSAIRWLPILALLVAFAATLQIVNTVFNRLPRLEDEMAYIYQARLFAQGQLYAATPVEPVAFGIPFVVDLQGKRFSKYPPGGSLTLAVGQALGDIWIIGPFLGLLALAVTYRLALDLFDQSTAILALLLGLVSPFFLVLTPSLMAHSATMLAAAVFALAFFRLHRAALPRHPHHLALLAGCALGFEFIVRPYTAVWSAVPFGLLALWQIRQRPTRFWLYYLEMAAPVLLSVLGLLLFNSILTNQLRLSLYDLWWSFDTLGFGPDKGPHGYTVAAGISKTLADLQALSSDLHGVPFLSWLPFALGLLVAPHSKKDLLLFSTLLWLIVGAFLYHSGSRLYGPRYFYEAWPFLMILAARGLLKVWAFTRAAPIVRIAFFIIVGVYFGIGVGLYLPFRMRLLSTIQNGDLNWNVQTATQQAQLHHALVFLFADDWPAAAAGTLLTDTAMQGDVLYPRYLGPDSYRAIVAAFPDRTAYFWRDGQLTPATDPPPDWTPAYPTVRYPNP